VQDANESSELAQASARTDCSAKSMDVNIDLDEYEQRAEDELQLNVERNDRFSEDDSSSCPTPRRWSFDEDWNRPVDKEVIEDMPTYTPLHRRIDNAIRKHEYEHEAETNWLKEIPIEKYIPQNDKILLRIGYARCGEDFNKIFHDLRLCGSTEIKVPLEGELADDNTPYWRSSEFWAKAYKHGADMIGNMFPFSALAHMECDYTIDSSVVHAFYRTLHGLQKVHGAYDVNMYRKEMPEGIHYYPSIFAAEIYLIYFLNIRTFKPQGCLQQLLYSIQKIDRRLPELDQFSRVMQAYTRYRQQVEKRPPIVKEMKYPQNPMMPPSTYKMRRKKALPIKPTLQKK